MTILRKLLIALSMCAAMPMAFGYSALQLKKELVLIDNFTKELRKRENPQAQMLVTYLEDILKNDGGNWYDHRSEKTRYVSDDEVLAIVRIIKADMTFEVEQSEIAKIMIEVLEKDVKIKAQRTKEKWLDRLFVGSILALFPIAVLLDSLLAKKA